MGRELNYGTLASGLAGYQIWSHFRVDDYARTERKVNPASIDARMKKCTWCGKEYSDDATVCAVDAQPLVQIETNLSGKSSSGNPELKHTLFAKINTIMSGSANRPGSDAMLSDDAAKSSTQIDSGLGCVVGSGSSSPTEPVPGKESMISESHSESDHSMKGVILGYEPQTSAGVILGSDDKRYRLLKSEWKSARDPRVGMDINFLTSGDDLAKEVYCIPSTVENRSGAQFAVSEQNLRNFFGHKLVIIGSCCILLLLSVVLSLHLGQSNSKTVETAPEISGQQSSSDDAIKSTFYDKGFSEGKEAGYLLGIDNARHNQNSSAMIQTIAKSAVKEANINLRGQGQPALSEAESEGIVDGYVQGYADGQRKVFVDGQ